MGFVGDESQKSVVINHCKRLAKTDHLEAAIQIGRKQGLLDKKNRLTRDGYAIALMSNFNEHVSVEPWKDYWSK